MLIGQKESAGQFSTSNNSSGVSLQRHIIMTPEEIFLHSSSGDITLELVSGGEMTDLLWSISKMVAAVMDLRRRLGGGRS